MKEETKKDIKSYLGRAIRLFIVLIIIDISFKLVAFKGVDLFFDEKPTFINILLALAGVVGIIGSILYSAREITIMQKEKENKKKEQNHDR